MGDLGNAQPESVLHRDPARATATPGRAFPETFVQFTVNNSQQQYLNTCPSCWHVKHLLAPFFGQLRLK
jgi:hypothetical protein